jgi:hypothetical protein
LTSPTWQTHRPRFELPLWSFIRRSGSRSAPIFHDAKPLMHVNQQEDVAT